MATSVCAELNDAEVVNLLDRVLAELTGHRTVEALSELVLGLHGYWARLIGQEEWDVFTAFCRRHALADLLHQDPFTSRAFHKPRGYAGDADLLDFVYGVDDAAEVPSGTTRIGQEIFACTTSGPTARAVRERRRLLAQFLDCTADEICLPDILAVAAGHLREADLSTAVRQGQIGRFVALEPDAANVQTIEQRYARLGVEGVHAPARNLFSYNLELGQFDLIYSAGIYDYLSQKAAWHLTESLFQRLKPGGRLLVATLLPGACDVGYMECYMDWHLVYRTMSELQDLSTVLPRSQVRGVDSFTEPSRTVAFLEITRTGKSRKRVPGVGVLDQRFAGGNAGLSAGKDANERVPV